MESCPICKSKIKGGIFNSKQWGDPEKVSLINLFRENPHENICYDCVQPLYYDAKKLLSKEVSILKNDIETFKEKIIVSTCNPSDNWEYKIKGLATASITVGTSAITDMSSSLTDFIGGESGKYKAVIEKAEQECLSRLKHKAALSNSNFISGFKTDYSDVGGVKSMIMINMYGTLLKVEKSNNFDVIDENIDDIIEKYEMLLERKIKITD